MRKSYNRQTDSQPFFLRKPSGDDKNRDTINNPDSSASDHSVGKDEEANVGCKAGKNVAQAYNNTSDHRCEASTNTRKIKARDWHQYSIEN